MTEGPTKLKLLEVLRRVSAAMTSGDAIALDVVKDRVEEVLEAAEGAGLALSVDEFHKSLKLAMHDPELSNLDPVLVELRGGELVPFKGFVVPVGGGSLTLRSHARKGS